MLQNPKRSLRWESAEVALKPFRPIVPIANGAYYHLIYAFATEKRSGIKPPLHKGSTFATVGCGVFLQAGDGHGHLVRQAPFLLAREFA